MAFAAGKSSPAGGHEQGQESRHQLYVPLDDKGEKWETHLIDDNHMACEDLKIADLDADGHPDIIASGRASHNLVIYWNKTKFPVDANTAAKRKSRHYFRPWQGSQLIAGG